MPGSPPTTTRLGLPRYAQTDAAQFSPQVNAIVDALDPITARTDDARFTNARTPTTHAATHQPGGSDAMAVDAAPATASLRTLGTGANQAAAGNDARLRGGDFASVSGLQVYDVGVLNQIRAGRQLTVADFTNLGLSQPIGLWNLSDLTNLGSDATAPTNKGTVTFAAGINGAATTAAQFTGSTAQALYIAGPATAYQIKTGSWGCWFRTAKRGVNASLLSKMSVAAGNYSWEMSVAASNVLGGVVSSDGSAFVAPAGVSDVADDRWHFGVLTVDGTAVRLFVDGALEAIAPVGREIFASTAPVNIGGRSADSGTAAGQPHYGRVDEAFVTADVLSEDQVRCLYAAKLTHTLGVTPTGVRLNVHRKRKGAPLVVGDFTTTPLRSYGFTAGDLVGVGSNASGDRTLVPAGTTGAPVLVASADGTLGGAWHFPTGAGWLAANDAGLPDALLPRSYGVWLKFTTTALVAVMGWGASPAVNDAALVVNSFTSGTVTARSGGNNMTGPFVADGQWHHVVVVEDNTAVDLVKRKMYVDGRFVVGSLVMNPITLGSPGFTNRFRIGTESTGGTPFIGTVDGVFVTGYAMDAADVARVYAKGAQDLGASPKNPGDHVERMSTTDVLFIGDTLESQHVIDLGVVA